MVNGESMSLVFRETCDWRWTSRSLSLIRRPEVQIRHLKGTQVLYTRMDVPRTEGLYYDVL